VRLGSVANKPRFAWALVPNEVIEAAHVVLDPDTKSWSVNRIEHFADTPYTVVSLTDHAFNSFICAVSDNTWNRVAIKSSVPTISRVLSGNLRNSAAIHDSSKTEQFCSAVSYLFRGPKRQVVTTRFPQEHPTITAWLQGREKDPKKIHELCLAPEVKELDGGNTITYNVVTGSGAIEQWIIRGRFDKAGFSIDGIDVTETKPQGTFSWGNVP